MAFYPAGAPSLATNSQAGATAPSASLAAPTNGTLFVASKVRIGLAAGATAQPAVQVNLRNGATGAGTILTSWQVSAAANSAININEALTTGLYASSANTALTLEFASAPAASTTSSVTLEAQQGSIA